MLENRSTEKEQLDNLNLGGETLRKTLDGLSIINNFLGNTNATFEAVKPIIQEAENSLTIIDLGCGGGDNLRKIAKWCFGKNIGVRLMGIDGNQHILDYARAKNTSEVHVQYVQADILSAEFEVPYCDILLSSHFMYHFSDEGLTNFLRTAKNRVRKNIIFSELERNNMAHRLFSFATFFMPFSKIVKQDGIRAIERAFKQCELETIIENAALEAFMLERKWAFRLLVVIRLNVI